MDFETGITVPVEQPTYDQGPAPVTVAPANPELAVDPLTLEGRANRYDQALGNRSPGVDTLRSRLQVHGDSLVRAEHAMQLERELLTRRAKIINDYMAGRAPGDVRNEEVGYIQSVASGELARIESDPRSFFEARRAEQTNAMARPENTPTTDPLVDLANQAATRVHTLQEYAMFRLEALQQEARAPSRHVVPEGDAFSPAGRDFIGSLASPLQWYREMNRLRGQSYTNSFLLGNNQSEQAQWYYSQKDTKTAIDALDAAVNELKGQNLNTALDFLQAIAHNDQSTFSINNFLSFLDVAPGVGFVPYKVAALGTMAALRRSGIVAARDTAFSQPFHVVNGVVQGGPAPTVGGRVFNEGMGTANDPIAAALAAQDAAQAAIRNRNYPNPAPVLEAAGDIRRAADYTAREQLIADASRTGQVDSLDGLRGYGRALFNSDQVITEAGTALSNEAAQRLRVGLNADAETLAAAITGNIRIRHLTPGSYAERAAAEDARRIAMNHQYAHVSNRVIDAGLIRQATLEGLPPKARVAAESAIQLEKRISLGEKVGLYNEFVQNKMMWMNELAEGKMLLQAQRATGKNAKADWRNAAAKIDAKERLAVLRKSNVARNNWEGKIPKADRDLFEEAFKAGMKYEIVANELKLTQKRPLGWTRAVEGYVPPNIIDGFGNVRYVAIKLGNEAAELFETAKAARWSAVHEMNLHPSNFRVIPQGKGFYVEVQKAINITTDRTRAWASLEIKNSKDATPRPIFANQVLNKILGGDLKRSAELTADAKVAVYGSANLYSTVSNIVNKSIGDLPRFTKSDRAEWLKFVEHQRVFTDPKTKETGMFSRNQWDMEQMFKDVNGKLPTEAQSRAYWTYVQISNFDKALLDFGIYRDKTLSGMENFWFGYKGFKLNEKFAPPFEGKLVDEIPEAAARERNAGYVIWDGDPATATHVYHHTTGATKKINDALNSGYKIVQLSPYGSDDFKKLPNMKPEIINSRINFVLSKDVTSSPLGYQQTPNRAGGHHTYSYEHYVRQPDVRNGTYYGDITIRGFLSKEDNVTHAKALDKGRRLYKEVKDGSVSAEARLAAHVDKELPYSVQAFKNLFDTGQYNIDAPFLTTRNGQRTWDVHKLENKYGSDVRDIVSDPLSLYQATNLRYALERGMRLTTVDTFGTEANPVHKIIAAPLISAYTTMDRAIKHLANNMHMGDYQIKATERFIAEFSHVMEPSKRALYADPLDALINPKWKIGADPIERAAAERYRDAAMEILRVSSPSKRDYDHWKDKLVSILDSKLGESTARRVTEWNLYKQITNPIAAAKDATMHYFLMAPQQLFVQAMGVAHVSALAGPHIALEAMAAAIYGRIARDYTGAKGMLEHAAEAVFKINGWKREDFVEGFKLGRDMGFLNVDREYAVANAFDDPLASSVAGGVTKLKHIGMTPFRKGEEVVRHTGWWAAYREWKVANRDRPPTSFEAAAILARADDMAVNMSQASMSTAQYSMLKIPATFWSFNQRVMEQIWGGKLSPLQVAAVMGNYSILFGIPTALGAATMGIPIYDLVNRYLLANDIVPDRQNDYVWNWALNGALGTAVEATTGRQFNVAQRYGPGNSKMLVDLIGDKAGLELIMGATGSMFRDLYTKSVPFFRFLGDMVNPPREDVREAQQLQSYHFRDWMSTQRGVDQLFRSFWALNYGEYLSRNGGGVTDDIMDTTESIILGITGLTPQRINNSYALLENAESLKNMQQDMEKRITRSWRAALDSLNSGNVEQAQSHQRDIRIGFALGRFTYNQQTAVINRAMKEHKSLVESVLERTARNTDTGERLYRAYQDLANTRRR